MQNAPVFPEIPMTKDWGFPEVNWQTSAMVKIPELHARPTVGISLHA